MKITKLPDGGSLYLPESQEEHDFLQQLIAKGALHEAKPEDEQVQSLVPVPVITEIDFINLFYPLNPGAAKTYFKAELNINGEISKENNNERFKTRNS